MGLRLTDISKEDSDAAEKFWRGLRDGEQFGMGGNSVSA